MKNSWSSTLILGLMIPCLTFLFTSAPAPASDKPVAGSFHLTEDHSYQIIVSNPPSDCSVFIENDGPGHIMVTVFDPDPLHPAWQRVVANGTTGIAFVKKGGTMCISLIDKESYAKGKYYVSPFGH